jgi:hypothetical protein
VLDREMSSRRPDRRRSMVLDDEDGAGDLINQ